MIYYINYRRFKGVSPSRFSEIPLNEDQTKKLLEFLRTLLPEGYFEAVEAIYTPKVMPW